jgi:cobalt/nickel transport system permease protein
MVKAWLSVLSMLVLSSTTEFPALLQGLERLGLPRVMVMLFSFMYRYLFVMVEEVNRMRLARDSRNLGRKRMWQIRSVGNMIGTLFLRSYERGERIYQAMVSRGFEGEVRTMNRLRLGRADLGFAVAFLLYLAVVALASHLWL